jgi:outer membrane protein assembly factor BamB
MRHALLVLALAAPSPAADFHWPQWRGPARDGVVSAFPARASWPEALAPDWKLAVGTGHSSPIVAGGRVYQHSRQGEDEVVRALDLGTGKELWRQSYAVAYEMNPAASGHGKGPKATPVLADGRLFTFGITGVLSAWDAASGRLLWRKGFEHSPPEFGAAASPVVSGGRVILHTGGRDHGALVALDAASGAQRWSWSGDGPGYASPVVATFDGVEQVVTQTQSAIAGVATATGALLWQEALRTPYDQNAVTPVVHGGLVVYSGLNAPLRAGRPKKRGSGFVLESAWSNAEVGCYMSTPVVLAGRIFGLSHKKKGQYFAVDAANGRTLWLSEGRAGENASVLAGDGVLFLLDTDGTLTVAAADPSAFRPLRRWKVAASATWAHPVVMPDAVLVKDVDTLLLLRLR